YIQVLHPRYKAQYFHDAEWEQEWIDTAVNSARETWCKFYKIKVTAVARPSTADDNNPFAAVERYGLNTTEDVFEEYIASPRDTSITDVIAHWSARLPKPDDRIITSQHMLAQMALDFLSAPATSTDVECLFSHAGLVVDKHHHSLGAESTQESVCLQHWSCIPDIIPKKDLIKSFNAKSKRKKKKGMESEETDDGDEDSFLSDTAT
ncbi:hypothetical protein MPER_09785, partial [Moniliophthora perniciosa FA553]